MNCCKCKQLFDLQANNEGNKQTYSPNIQQKTSEIECIPRILIQCGHTMCQRCLSDFIHKSIEQQLSSEQILSSHFNKCPECLHSILTPLQITDLSLITAQDHQAVQSFVADKFPVNKALFILKETFQMMQIVQQNSKLQKQLSSCDQDQDIDVEEIDQQFINYDPQFKKIQNDFKTIQAQKEMENELFSKRQRLITYMTLHSDDEESSDESNFADGLFEDYKNTDQNALNRNIIKKTISPIRKKKSLKCKTHQQKKIEAFCENCKTVLCISCILLQQHKGHEMVQIEQGAKVQREYFLQQINQVHQIQNAIENQILNIQNHICETESQARKQSDKISQIFNEVRQRILVREQLLKKRLSEMLESEQALYKKKIENLKDQIKCISDLDQEKPKIQNETDIQVLQKCKVRHELLSEASKEIGNDKLINRIPMIKKEEELACLVTLILPKKLREKILLQNNQTFQKLRKPQCSLETVRRYTESVSLAPKSKQKDTRQKTTKAQTFAQGEGVAQQQTSGRFFFNQNTRGQASKEKNYPNGYNQAKQFDAKIEIGNVTNNYKIQINPRENRESSSKNNNTKNAKKNKEYLLPHHVQQQLMQKNHQSPSKPGGMNESIIEKFQQILPIGRKANNLEIHNTVSQIRNQSYNVQEIVTSRKKQIFSAGFNILNHKLSQEVKESYQASEKSDQNQTKNVSNLENYWSLTNLRISNQLSQTQQLQNLQSLKFNHTQKINIQQKQHDHKVVNDGTMNISEHISEQSNEQKTIKKNVPHFNLSLEKNTNRQNISKQEKISESHQKIEDFNKQFNLTINLSRSLSNLAKNSSQNSDKNIEKEINKIQQMNEIEKIEYKQNSMINQNDFTCLSLLKKIDDKFDEQQEGEVEEEEIDDNDDQKQRRRMCSTDEKVIDQMPINIQSSMKTQLQSEGHHEWALKIEKSSYKAIINQEQTCKPVNAASKKKGPQKNLKSSEKKHDKKNKMAQVPGSMISANDKYNKKNIVQKPSTAIMNSHFLLANSMNSGDNSNQTTKRNKLKQQEQLKYQNPQQKNKMKFNHMDLSKILNDIGQQNAIQSSLQMRKKDNQDHSQLNLHKSESPKQPANKDSKALKKEKSNSNNQSQDKIQLQNQIKNLRQTELNRVINQVKKGTPSSQINLNNHYVLDDKKSKLTNEKKEERSTSQKRKQWSQMNSQKLGISVEIPFNEINLFPIKSQKMSVVTQDQSQQIKNSLTKELKESDVQQLNSLALDISKSISQIINQPLLQIKEQYYKKQKSNQLLEARQITLIDESNEFQSNIDYIPENQSQNIQEEQTKKKEDLNSQVAQKIIEKSDQKQQILKQYNLSISNGQSMYLQNYLVKSNNFLQSNDITNDINSSSQYNINKQFKNQTNSQDLFNNILIQRPNTELGQKDDLQKNEQKIYEKKSSLYEQILEMKNSQSQHSNNLIKYQNEQICRLNMKQSVQVGISQIAIDQKLVRQNSKSSLSINNKNINESEIERQININQIHCGTNIQKKKMFKKQSQLSLNDQDNNIYSATQIKSKKDLSSNHLRRQSVVDYTSQQNIIHHQIIKKNVQNSIKDYNKSAKVEKIGKNQQLGLKKNQSQYSIDSKIIQSLQSQTSQKKLQNLSNKLKENNVEIYKNGKMKDKYKKLLKPSEEVTYQNLIEDDNEYCDYSDKQQDYSHASPKQIVQWTNQNIQKFIIDKNINSNDQQITEQQISSKLNERRNYMSEELKNSDRQNYDSEKHVSQRLVPISGIAMLQKSRSPQFIKKVGLGQLMRQFQLNITPQKSPLQTKIQSTKNNSGKLQVLESWITGEKDNKILKQQNNQNNSISHPKMESRKIGKIALEKEDQLEELNDEDMFPEDENLSSENLQINNKIFLQQKQRATFQNKEGNDRLSSQPPEPTEEDHPRKDALQSQLAIENIINSLAENQNNQQSLNSSCNFYEDDEHDQKQKDESEYYQDTKELDFRSQKKQKIEINQSSYSVAQQYANRPVKQFSQSIALKYANRNKIEDNQKTLKKGKKHIQINLDINSPQFDFIDDIQIENEKIPSDLLQGQLIKKSIQKKELRDLGFDQTRDRNQFDKINEFTRNMNFLNNGISSNKSMGQSVLNLSDPCKIYSPLTQNSNQQSFLDQKLKDILQKEQQIKVCEKEQVENINRKTVKTPLQNKNTFIQIGTTPIQDFQNSTEIHRIMQISRRFGGASSAVLEDQRDFDKKKLYKADDKSEMFGQLQNNNIRSKNVKSVLSNKKIEEQKIMNNSIQQILHIQNVNNQPEINKREKYFNIEQLNNSKKKQKSQTNLNNKKQNIIHKQNLPTVNSLLKNQSQYASQKELKSEFTLLNNQNLASQNSLTSINLSKSEIYKAKEEFIFVFGGVNIGSSKSKNSKNKLERLSIEVIDILREISREFKNEQESDDEKQIIQINKNLSLPVVGFAATQFEFIQSSFHSKVANSKESQSKDKIYLIGGQDLFGNILDTVFEYSIKDMQIFQADWKLPFPTKDFAITKQTNLNSRISSNIIIAGGVTLSSSKNEQTKTRNLSKNVFRIYQEQKQNNEQEQLLGIDMQSGFLIKYEQLPDMQKQRSQFQLIFKQMQKNEFEIYAVGGIQDFQSDSSQFIEKYSSHNRKWEYVQVKLENKELNEQIFCLKSHQSLFMPDGSILIVGGQVLEKNGGKIEQWKFTKNMIKFDTETNEMSQMPQMNQARGFFSLILSQSLRYIYVIGGFTNSKKKANKQVWQDLVNNSLVNQIDQDEDKELLTGIIRNTGCLNSIEKFDVFSKKWQLVAPLNQKRGMHASCQIYI